MKKSLDFVGCDRYDIYADDKIINTQTGREIKSSLDRDGYCIVTLYTKASNYLKPKTFRRHKLVALAFIPNPENKRTIHHINGNKEDNNFINLKWATDLENVGLGHINNQYTQRKDKETYYAIQNAILNKMGWHKIRDTFNVGTATISKMKNKMVSWEEYYGQECND